MTLWLGRTFLHYYTRGLQFNIFPKMGWLWDFWMGKEFFLESVLQSETIREEVYNKE